MTLDLSPEEIKAWSQNLGHADVLTTLPSYGQVPTHRQGKLIRGLAERREPALLDADPWALIEVPLASRKTRV